MTFRDAWKAWENVTTHENEHSYNNWKITGEITGELRLVSTEDDIPVVPLRDALTYSIRLSPTDTGKLVNSCV